MSELEKATNLPYAPWEVVGPSTQNSDCFRIFSGSDYLATVGNSDFEKDHNEAIARLMAAAPCLYRALDNLLDIVKPIPIPERTPLSWLACIAEAQDALQRAKEQGE